MQTNKATQPRKKRSKQVFRTNEVPHLWAHRTQNSARNAQGNLYFEDGIIYSYGSHLQRRICVPTS